MFADTGAFYALADRRDPAHERARAWYSTSTAALITTDFVFAETMSLLTKRVGKPVAVAFGRGLREGSRVRVHEVPPEVRVAAWSLFSSRADKDWDLIDCMSFALMESLGIDEAFAFDGHFLQHGFRLAP